ncbi:TonB-dependent receptor [Rhizorhabdus dicambivorans]|nr:TonB-dependent receptor [Rhizorhabdus dicambivorans]
MPGVVYAQAAAEEVANAGDIVVTAQKRSESIQKVPISLAAISGEGLAEKQVNNVDALAATVPGLTFGYYGGNARIAIRGVGFDSIGQGTEGRVTYHVDGIYFARPSSTSGTFFDVERIEVLRGPQGTLYGRNATGGSINVITRAPTDTLEGYGRVTLGNYATVITEGAVSGPLSDTVSARIAFMTNNHDGYGKNIITGTDIDDARNQSVRASLSFKPSESFKLDLTADYARRNDHNNGLHYFGQSNPAVPLAGRRFGGIVATDVRDISSEFDPRNKAEFAGGRANMEFDFGAVTFRSITGYRYADSQNVVDIDLTNIALGPTDFHETGKEFTQELQLTGTLGDSKWIVGGYFFDEKIKGGGIIPFNALNLGGPNLQLQGYEAFSDLHTRAYAAFGQIDIAVSDKLTFTLGGRYGWERQNINTWLQLDFSRPYSPNNPPIKLFTVIDSKSWDAFTPKAGVQYQFAPSFMGYATVSKGFKSGGYNGGSTQPPFNPETVWAYEAGVKASLPGGGRFNLSGFYYDYRNMQVSITEATTITIENAASSTLYGGEVEVNYPLTDQFWLDFSGAYLYSKFNDYTSEDPSFPLNPPRDLNGNRLVQAPRFSIVAGAEYRTDLSFGSMTLRGEVNWVGKTYFTAYNNETDAQPRYAKANAYLNIESSDKKWVGSLFMKNITNKNVRTSGVVTAALFGSPSVGSLQPPRTFGGSVQFNF